MEGVQKIALFIDADNVSSRFGKLFMDNLEKRGEVTVRRIYGNWEKPALRKWDDCILSYGLRTVHQIDFSTGKNATDMTLTIDAMDVLHQQQATTFAIVSSDSDFTPLVVRLREYGIYVIGMGRKDSSVSFKNACNEFVSLDSLEAEAAEEGKFRAAAEEKETSTQKIQPLPYGSESALKILELERKIAELERKIASPQWSIGFRLTAEENKNSARQVSSTKIKQKIICNTLTPSIIESPEPVEVAPKVEEPKSPIVIEVVPLEPARTVDVTENATEIEGVVSFKPIPIQPAKTADENISVELTPADSAQVAKKKGADNPPLETPATTAAVVDPKAAERVKAMNLRLSQCGQRGMRNPKKKMQQIHDALRESARLHGDKNGFVPLTFAGQDLKKKNLGFGVKDFGYMLLNEFISDFPELYELAHTKPRSFRYRCL